MTALRRLFARLFAPEPEPTPDPYDLDAPISGPRDQYIADEIEKMKDKHDKV